MIPSWKPTVDQKRSLQVATIPPSWRLSAPIPIWQTTLETIRSCNILSPQELEWTETTDVAKLLSLLASQEVSSVQVTTAFCKRAAIAQQLTRCLTEIFFDRALVKAQELDEYLARTGKTVGPLHGLPVSIKDRFDVEGYDTTIGMFSTLFYLFSVRGANVNECIGWVGLVGKPAQKSSSIAQMLESMGAVLYVKTNVPQSLMVCLPPPNCVFVY